MRDQKLTYICVAFLIIVRNKRKRCEDRWKRSNVQLHIDYRVRDGLTLLLLVLGKRHVCKTMVPGKGEEHSVLCLFF